MKYKYIVGVLVALNSGSVFSADAAVVVDLSDNGYRDAYAALTTSAGTALNKVKAALTGRQTFNHDNDKNIVRGCSAGFELRKAVIGLSPEHLKEVVDANTEFFQTSLGISLVYGWAMNKCDKVVTPYYIGRYFSFDKLFQGLAGNIGDASTQTFLSSTFKLGLNAVEATEDARWAFYHHLMYLPYAIEQVRAAAPVVSALSMDVVIAGARRTAAETQHEAQVMLGNASGRANHLRDEATFGRSANPFVILQERTVLEPGDCVTINLTTLAVFRSLPASTADDYSFKGKTVAEYMAAINAAMDDANALVPADPSGVKVEDERESERLERLAKERAAAEQAQKSAQEQEARLEARRVAERERDEEKREATTKILALQKLDARFLTPSTFTDHCVTAINVARTLKLAELQDYVTELANCKLGDDWSAELLQPALVYKKKAPNRVTQDQVTAREGERTAAVQRNTAKLQKQRAAHALLAFLKSMKVS